jgi:NTP pyrophosphatase (non-canonical NTP hydrolase)
MDIKQCELILAMLLDHSVMVERPTYTKCIQFLLDRITITEKEYSDFVGYRAKRMEGPEAEIHNLLHAAVGVSGEAGELLDAIKKSWIYHKPLNDHNVMEECGDALFYIQMICNHYGITITDLVEQNMEKLRKRYPDGYSDAAAQARADKTGSE